LAGRVTTATGLAVDNAGNLYLSGTTESQDFPVFNSIKLALFDRPTRSRRQRLLREISFLFESDRRQRHRGRVSVAAGSDGSAYITGKTTSVDFPIVAPIQPVYGRTSDAFVSKVAPMAERIS
jgi:hypothetical protein